MYCSRGAKPAEPSWLDSAPPLPTPLGCLGAMCRKLSGLDGRKIIQTGNEPSVAPHVPSVTAHLLQGCCSRFNHLQTQAAPIHHPSPSSLHTNNVVLGPINRVMASPPKTGLMSFAALSKAKRCSRSPKTTTSPMKRCGGCFMRRASKARGGTHAQSATRPRYTPVPRAPECLQTHPGAQPEA